MFVGYSLVDETFVLLSNQVQDVLRGAEGWDRQVATALSITKDQHLASRRPANLGLIEMPVEPGAERSGARLLEIFLDRLLWRTTTLRDDAIQHLLDERYAEMPRPPEDLTLQTTLLEFIESVPDHARRSEGWRHVRHALLQLGADLDSL
jgi:hypothetical protein